MKKLFILFAVCVMNAFLSVSDAAVRWALSGLPAELICSDFHDGLAVFRNRDLNLYGAINTRGEIVIPAKFKTMSEFCYGVSFVSTENGKGFVNKQGAFILSPDASLEFNDVYGKDEYGQDNPINGLYKITNKKTQEVGYWYKNHMVLPFSKERKYGMFFPFVTWRDPKDIHDKILNLETGEIVSGNIIQKGLLLEINIPTPNGTESRLYNFSGKEFKKTEISSKGIRIVQGERPSQHSLINSSGDTILSANDGWYTWYPTWLNDMVLMSKYTKLDNGLTEYIYRLYGADGKQIFEKKIRCDEYSIGIFNGYGVMINTDHKQQSNTDLYTTSGKKIATAENDYIYTKYEEWFTYSDQKGQYLINASTGKKVPYTSGLEKISDDMIVGHNNSSYFIINLKSKSYIPLAFPNISSVSSYSDGLARVRLKEGNDMMIDKFGHPVITENDQFGIYSSTSSEGVIVVKSKKSPYNFGYICNPLCNNASLYGGKEEYNKWLYDKGEELFNQKNYAQAKDCFYDLMINEPNNVNSIIYYGSCLNNLGYYDSSIDAFHTALKIDPSNELAKKYLKIAENNLLQENQRAEQQQNQSNVANWFDGLTQFLNVLGETFSEFAEFSNNMNSSRSSGSSYSSPSSSRSSNSYQSGGDNMNKSRDARTYSDLESQLIKMNTYYNTYNDNQRRSIQSQMRSIRTKWEGRGFRMFHSSWEDWDGRKR